MKTANNYSTNKYGYRPNQLTNRRTQSINNARGFFRNSLTQGTRLIRFNIVNVMMENSIDVLLTQMTSQILYPLPHHTKQTCISTQTITLKERKDRDDDQQE